MKYLKLLGYFLIIGGVVAFCGFIFIRECLIYSSYPLIRGGERVSPNNLFTARSLAIIEQPFFGKEHRYYRFELREGGYSNTGPYGRILREVTMEPLPGEEFWMPRAEPAFPPKWNGDCTTVSFLGQGIELTLHASKEEITQDADPTKQFYNSINSNWQSWNNTKILSIINARLRSKPDDVWASYLKVVFYAFVQKDIPEAQQEASRFLSTVNSGTTNQALKDRAQAMVKEILAIPASENTPYTQSQINSMHSLFPSFPCIDEGMIFWAQFTGQL